MKNHQRKEQGQIIILLAVSIVVVMMVAALAVDGGMIYTERRFAQNAADSAAFAGGGAVLNSGELDEVLVCPASSSDSLIATAISQAQARAAANNISSLPFLGYEINNEDFVPDENQGIWVVCNDNIDPKTIDVIVRVTSQVSTAFAHLIYPGPLQTTNEAVISVSQKGVSSSGDTIISLSDKCNSHGNQNNNDGGVIFNNANLILNITNGSVFSNSCLNLHKNATEVNVDGGFKIVKHVIGSWPQNLMDQIITGQSPWIDNYPNFTSPKDMCAEFENNGDYLKDDSDNVLSEGYYPAGIKVTAGKDLTLNKGLYCVGSEFTVNNGSVTGTDVTIYLYDQTKYKLTGGTIKLVAPTKSTDPYYGLLFYLEGDTDTIWNGNNNTFINGRFYAPSRNIQFSGNSDNINGTCPGIDGFDCLTIKFPTQIIGNQIVFKGSATINIDNSGRELSSLQNNLFLKD